MKHTVLIILIAGTLISNLTTIYSQNNTWRLHLELLAEEGVDEASIDNMYQELVMLENNPMNLNTVSRNELERMPLLSFEEATSIADFLDKNRPVYTTYELRNVPRLDFNTIEMILPLFYVGEMDKDKVSVSTMLKYGKHELSNRFDKVMNKRAGYKQYSDSILQKYPNRKYAGEDFYTALKYSFTYRDKIQFGVLGEKDAGEPFWQKKYTKGYDHYGIHMIVRDIGNLKTLAIGDYRLSFGQGLILNNDFMLSKSWATSNIIKRTQEPKRHFSTAESGFFRGISAVYKVGKVNVTAFYSNKAFDANISELGEMTSFKNDGYHRTPSEMEKKNNTREQVVGANINWRKSGLQIGASALYHKYNRVLNPTLKQYNWYYLRNDHSYNASIDYSYYHSKIAFAGEIAMAPNGSVAALNILQYKPNYLYSFSLLHRHLPKSYNAMHAKAFMEGSRVQNENGIYFGTSMKPFRNFSATTYIDIYKFPWLKYQVDAPSKGVDIYLLADYNIGNNSNLEFRYKYKQKEQNATLADNERAVLPYDTQKARLRYNHTLINGWQFRTTADFALFHKKHSEKESGYMLSQGISHRGNNKVQGDLYLAYFNSDSYAARLYSYERNILSTFYMPSFYGEGIRLALSGRYNITPKLSLSLKMGYTNYFDKKSIGTGTEQIIGSSRMDLFTFIRWKF